MPHSRGGKLVDDHGAASVLGSHFIEHLSCSLQNTHGLTESLYNADERTNIKPNCLQSQTAGEARHEEEHRREHHHQHPTVAAQAVGNDLPLLLPRVDGREMERFLAAAA